MKKCLVLGLVLALSIGSAIAEDSIDLTHPQQVRIKNEERAQVSLSSQDINKTIKENNAANSMLELSLDFPNEPLVSFHSQRIKKGLVTTLVVMEDK